MDYTCILTLLFLLFILQFTNEIFTFVKKLKKTIDI